MFCCLSSLSFKIKLLKQNIFNIKIYKRHFLPKEKLLNFNMKSNMNIFVDIKDEIQIDFFFA